MAPLPLLDAPSAAEINAIADLQDAALRNLWITWSYYRLNREIHDRINAAACNRALAQSYANQNLRIQNLRFRSNFDDDKWAKAARQHEAMVEALEARDGQRLARILRDHLQAKCDAVLESMKERAA